MKRYFLLVFFVIFKSMHVNAQSDSTKVLNFEQYMQRVKAHHPVAKQADLLTEKGKAAVLKARGSFDPVLGGNFDQKYFKEKDYYKLLNAGLQVPTWFGITVKTGFEQNDTYYDDAELATPESGLWYAGISVPIGQGLFIDERRAELKKAKIYRESAQAERKQTLNELVYEAGKAYWEWYEAFQALKVYEQALELSQKRMLAIGQEAELGDRPAIDTLEAGIQRQSWDVSRQQAALQLKNSKAKLSLFLWQEGVIPVELAPETVPEMPQIEESPEDLSSMFKDMESAMINHPELQQYRYKIDGLLVDKALKQDKLKPKIKLNYNALTEHVNGDPMANYSPNDYKIGVEVSMPIFLRKERGDLKLAKLKLQEAQLEQSYKQQGIAYKIGTALNEWETTSEQMEVFDQTVKDYGKLLEGENQLFRAGESSMFKVNYREQSYIKAQLKLLSLQTKNQKAILAAKFALGQLGSSN